MLMATLLPVQYQQESQNKINVYTGWKQITAVVPQPLRKLLPELMNVKDKGYQFSTR